MKRPATILISVGAGFVLLAAGTAAGAATGGNFILGKANSENTQATLTNSAGTPLKLNSPPFVAPLKVSNSTLVHGLNAQFVGGMFATELATGGDGFTAPVTDTPLTTAPEAIVATGPLPAGTYYVTATALLFIQAGDIAGLCSITKGSDPNVLASGGATTQGLGQAAATVPVSVTDGDTLQWACSAGGTHGSFVNNAGITAIRVLSSNGTAPAKAGHPIAALPGGLAPQGR